MDTIFVEQIKKTIKKILKMIKKLKRNNLKSFSFIVDKPLTKDAEDEFGHAEVAESLYKMVMAAKPHFTFGLYGSWGTGKSTVIQLLINRLEKAKVKYVSFDVWKYENDSLRRQFLLECLEQLSGDEKEIEELKKSFTHTVQRQEEGDFKLLRKGLTLRLIFSLIAGFFISELYVLSTGAILTPLGILLTTLVLTPSITVLTIVAEIIYGRFLSGIVIIDQLTLTKDKLSQPEEFQDKFREIINRVDGDRIVFILDNLDRATYEKSVELLTTVKAFLEEDKCIFVVPCDEDAIKRHIASAYLSQGANDAEESNAEEVADEFLRKFFNAIVRIPKSENLELDTYTAKKLKSTNLPELKNNSDLEGIITTAFRSNPREIKQFINTLISSVLLVRERIQSGDITNKNILKENIAFLAKMLIFKQKYPRPYSKFEEFVLKNGFTWEDMEKLGDQPFDDKDKKAFKFLSDTKSIIPISTELQFFITFNQSEEEKELPGWNQFLKSALDKEIEQATSLVEGFEKSNKLEAFDYVASNYLRVNEGKKVRTQPFISTFIKLVTEKKPNMVIPKLGSRIADLLPPLIESYEDYPIRKVFSFFESRSLNPTQERALSASYVNLIEKTQENAPIVSITQSKEILEFIAKNPKKFDSQISRVRDILSGPTYNSRENLDLFKGSEEKNKFIEAPLSQYIEQFKANIFGQEPLDINSSQEDINWLSTPGLLTKNQFAVMVTVLRRYFEKENEKNPPDIARRKTIMDITKNYFSYYLSKGWNLTDLGIKGDIDYISDRAIEWFPNDPSPDFRNSNFLLSHSLWKAVEDDRKTSLEANVIRPYLSQGKTGDYSKLKGDFLKKAIVDFPDEFIAASKSDVGVFNMGKDYLSKTRKDQYLIELADTSLKDALTIISEGYIPSNLGDVLKKGYANVNHLDNDGKEKLISISLKSKFANDHVVKEQFVTMATSLYKEAEGKTLITKYLTGMSRVVSRKITEGSKK